MDLNQNKGEKKVLLNCNNCGYDIEIDDCWDSLGDEIKCADCHHCYTLCYDEISNSETGEEQGWFYLE